MRRETRSRSDTSAALLLAAVIIGVAGVSCGGGGQRPTGVGTSPTCTPMPAEPVTLEGKVAVFDVTGIAEPISVVSQNGYIVVDLRSEREIPDLTIAFQQMILDAGFKVAGSDDEGFEAEVFFARGNVAAGQIILKTSPCPGAVDVEISVLDHPAVFPEESGTPPG
jgi:hypothetical protein